MKYNAYTNRVCALKTGLYGEIACTLYDRQTS